MEFLFCLIVFIFSAYNAESEKYNECSCLENQVTQDCPTFHFTSIPNSHFIFPMDEEQKTWSQAKASCESFKAELAEISSYSEYEALKNAITAEDSKEYWVGVVQKTPGKFVYTDGVNPISFSPQLSSYRTGECVFFSKNSDSPSAMYKMGECEQKKDFVCQYRRGTLCHLKQNWEGLRDTLLPDSGLFASLVQKTWDEAYFDCERHGMKLLTAVEKAKEHLPQLLEELKSKYSWKELWTSGKFTSGKYDELIWSTNEKKVRNFKDEWNPLSSVWEQNEPLDKSGNGQDLCLLMNIGKDNSITWSAENCQVPKYYICMQGLRKAQPRVELGRSIGRISNTSDVSYVEFCDGNTKVQITSATCSKNIIFSAKKPDCICFNGAHGTTDNESCKPSLYIGKSCVKLTSTEDVHWKILKQTTSGEPFVYIQTRNEKSGNYIQWSKLMNDSSRQLLGPTTIFYSGFKLFKLKKTAYCFQNNGTDSNDLSTIKQLTTKDSIGRIYVTKLCIGSNLVEYTGSDIQSDAYPIASQCTISCSDTSSGSNPSDSDTTSPGGGEEHPENSNFQSEAVRQHALSTLLVQDAIDSAFPNYKSDLLKFKPKRSFMLLDKLFEIAKHVCDGIVSKEFLKKGLELFKVLHYGKMYEYNEYFSEREASKIDTLLDKCLAEQEVATVRLDNCTGQVTHTENIHPNGTYDVRPVDVTGYRELPQHRIPELTWNVIDIMNVVCLKSFRSSYLLYHTLEQGMESLFTNEMRRMWHHPTTQADVYKQILGAEELTNMINLRSCADSIYQRYELVSRLERPREVVYKEVKSDSSSANSSSGIRKEVFAKCSPKTQCKI